MKTLFGSIVVAGAGKIGGHVASQNRGGSYLRTKVSPINRRTSYQQNVRQVFTSISQAWRGLTQAQRDAWNAAVTDWARTDMFGNLRNPSGANLFQRLNNNILQVGEALITSPPVVTVPESFPDAFSEFYPALGELTVNLDTATTTSAVLIFFKKRISAGIKVSFSDYQFLDYVRNEYDKRDVYAEFVKRIGYIPSVGETLLFAIQSVDIASGAKGPIVYLSGICES
jgi:hypothetical protein